ncbi:DUF724 domain-containing protein 10 isoform X1 [Brassica rapa]|uniref:Agenet domain-containing protein n=2 Tax=Brassica TaxID=3705 RepID=A0A8D9H788_BRACM|nr:DUF724 domain-containing protein 10 isoform X1 [Brassica rapa]XP_048614405.1 DUF724 domain-containing protein 10-like isoform X1 [Brassica napus]KAH0939028.1 hypothetical protein HID58_006489 [Brassica napus]CAF2141681.1 unnamed protein product [Brassica napus]CAG7894329.1 unnamed protein product [Brassica rapa]
MRSLPSERLSLMEGCQVEISYTNNRFKKVWYSATIELERQTKPKSRFRQRCVRVLKDDSLAPLTVFTHKASFRPIPTDRYEDRVEIKEGSIVDADHKDEWWVGLVVKQVGDDKFLVLFDTPSDIVLFKREQLRVHLDWVDETWWVLPGRSVQFLRQLHEKPMFISGAMVEVSDKIDKGEVVWVPAIIIKEIVDDEDEDEEEKEEEEEEEEEDEKKYFVKVCVNPSSFEGIKKRPNKEVDMRSIRPRPPPFSAEELKLVDYIEVFHGTSWRQGRVIGRVFRGRCKVLLEATNKLLSFKISDIRPSKVWEDGVWKPRESPSTQGSVDEMSDSSSTFSPASNSPRENPMESPLTQGLVDEISDSGNTFSPVSNSPPVTPSPSISATPLMQTRENGTREDNNRKRKREEKLSSVEETEARDITMVLPFEKKLPIWKTVESMEVFKTFPQSPHFTPLLEIREDAREMSAVGMLLTFSGLLEEVKSLKLNNPISSLNSLSDSFTELEKHGFDVKVPMLRISKLLSLIDRQAKKMEELEDCEKVTAEKESTKVENERKILELQKLNEEADKEIAQSKSCEATIGQQLDDVKLQFHTTASAPW